MIPFFRYGLPLALAAALPSLANAQAAGEDEAVTPSGLNLPSTLTTFGKVEPTLRKATAIVNGEIITGTDVEQRLALIILANGGKVPEEERDRLRVQVLRNLIDEVLQIQEAKANKIEVTDDDVNRTYARVSQNFKRTPEKMSEYHGFTAPG